MTIEPSTDERVETADLIAFLAVARCGSMGAAAAELRQATPSISARMTALERKFGTGLFTRSTRGSTLTAAGERLVPYARRCLTTLQEAHHSVAAPMHDRVIVAAPASLAAVAFAPVLDVLSRASITAHCRVAHSVEALGFLLDGTVDVALTINTVLPARLESVNVCRSEMVLVCRPDHPLSEQRSITVDDLRDTAVVVYRWAAEAEALAHMFGHADPPRTQPVQLTGLPAAALDTIASSDLVAVMPEFAVAQSLVAGRLSQLPLSLPTWGLDIQLAYTRTAARSRGITTLLDGIGELVTVLCPAGEATS
ncbi:LysR family transcriptional regulator [Nocardioidaceae bacterium SCSIO 66511]|nr:LysR family transcriptional regulator [Nocardioidaceae bacterium SCSIO 66511]